MLIKHENDLLHGFVPFSIKNTYPFGKSFKLIKKDLKPRELLFFYNDMCPYCVNTKPVLKELRDRLLGKGIPIGFMKYDTSYGMGSDANILISKLFNITGVPKIYYIRNGTELIMYDGKERSVKQFLKFIMDFETDKKVLKKIKKLIAELY